MSHPSSSDEPRQQGVSPALLSAVRVGVWSAAVVAVGYLLALIPNVEGVTLTIALAGATLGARSGFAVGLIGETLYSLFNPWGPPGFILLLAQAFSMASIGWMSGLIAPIMTSNRIYTRVGWGLFGLLASLWFDLWTTASFPLLAGMEGVSMATVLIAGLPFALTKGVVDTILFAVAFVPMRNRLKMILAGSIFRRGA